MFTKMVLAKTLRFLIIISNLSFPFVSTIGPKLALPNYFVLPVCLFQCDMVMRIFSFFILVTWIFLWIVLFKSNCNISSLILGKIILLTQVLLLFYDAVDVNGINILSSYAVFPTYVVIFCYILIFVKLYKFYLKTIFKTPDKAQSSQSLFHPKP